MKCSIIGILIGNSYIKISIKFIIIYIYIRIIYILWLIKYSRNIIAIGKAQYGAAENSSDYKYAVYYKLAAETDWQTAQNFSSNTEVVISPTELGEYDVCVKVKDLMGTIAKRYFTVKVTSLPL